MTTNGEHKTGVNAEGERLLKNWLDARNRIARLRREFNSAECDESNAQTALVRWLLPQDVKKGEKIAIWFGDSLIQVECLDINVPDLPDGKITVRQEGKTIREAL